MLYPTWKLEDRPKGKTLLVGGYVYHPGEDPVRQGRMNAMEMAVTINRQGGKRALVIGVGLGYMAAPLAALLDIPLAIWDSHPWVAPRERRERLLAAMEGARILRSEEEVSDWLTDDTVVIPHLSATDLQFWEISFCEARFSALNRTQIKQVSQRSVDFLKKLPSLGLVSEHYGLMRGRAVVLCSPGPTFDAAKVKLLRDEGYLVIAAAQVVPQLNATGVVPDVTVCLDPQAVIWERLQQGEHRWIYAEAMSDPRIWDSYPDRCFAFSVPTAHCHALVWREMGYPWMDDPAITVSEQMLEISHKLGACRVITSGVDYWSPVRTDLMKMECEGGRWSWTHYYAGYRAWLHLIRKYQMDWARLDEFPDPAALGDGEAVELPPPSAKTDAALIGHHVQQMFAQQPEQIQKQLESVLPPSIRQAFSPLIAVPVVVHLP